MIKWIDFQPIVKFFIGDCFSIVESFFTVNFLNGEYGWKRGEGVLFTTELILPIIPY